MFCPNCKREMQMKRGRHHYRESGLDNVVLENWPMFVCSKCETKIPLLPDPDEMAQTITRDLVLEKGPLNGDSIVFLRKAMGVTAAALAEMLEVNRVTVSRWENDKQKIDRFYDFRLRLLAVDRILPEGVRTLVRDSAVALLASGYTQESRPRTITIPGQVAAPVFSRATNASINGRPEQP